MALPERVLKIVERVAQEHRLTIDELMTGRSRDVTWARFHAWYEIYKLKQSGCRWVSTLRLGAWFDRDHTTILAGIRRWEGRVDAAEKV